MVFIACVDLLWRPRSGQRALLEVPGCRLLAVSACLDHLSCRLSVTRVDEHVSTHQHAPLNASYGRETRVKPVAH